MGGSRFVDVARIAQSGVDALIVAGVLDADGHAEEWATILFPGGGRVIGEELRNTVGSSVRLESLPEKDVSNGRRRYFPDPARVDDLRQRETKNALLRGDWWGQSLAQGFFLGLSSLLCAQTVNGRSAHRETQREGPAIPIRLVGR